MDKSSACSKRWKKEIVSKSLAEFLQSRDGKIFLLAGPTYSLVRKILYFDQMLNDCQLFTLIEHTIFYWFDNKLTLCDIYDCHKNLIQHTDKMKTNQMPVDGLWAENCGKFFIDEDDDTKFVGKYINLLVLQDINQTEVGVPPIG